MSKRLLFYCASKDWGGTEKNVLLRASEMAKRGYDVHVCTASHLLKQKAQELGLKQLYDMKSGGDFNPLTILWHIRFVKTIHPDILCLSMIKDYWLGGIAGRWNQISRVLMILGIERKVKRHFKYRWIFGRFCDALLVNSQQIKDSFLRDCNYLKEAQIHVIANGFPEKEYQPEEQTRFKKKFQIGTDELLIGLAGRIVAQKGFDLLPQLALTLKEKIPFKFMIAGDGPEKYALLKEIVQNNLDDYFLFIGFQENLDLFYNGIDLFLLCSRFEGMANVLNEAMSFGTQVISTHVSGVQELLQNGRFGKIVPIDDLSALSHAILTFYFAKDFSKKTELQTHIRINYSIKKMMDHVESVMLGTHEF